MSNELFDDEVLSAIIDGEADDAVVASVLADPAATKRLTEMRRVVDIVGEEPPPATPQRRQASIAAAMAAAQPASPEVTSLTAARHEREEKKKRRGIPPWLAVAAAVVLIAIAIPVIAALRPNSADTLTSAADSATDSAVEGASEFSLNSSDDGDDSDDSADDAAEEPAASSDAVDEEAAPLPAEPENAEDIAEATTDSGPDERAADDVADAAVSDDADASAGDAAQDLAEQAAPVPESEPFAIETLRERLADDEIPTAESLTGVNDLINLGAVRPQHSIADLEEAGLPTLCLQADVPTEEFAYDVVTLAPFTGSPELLIVRFNDDGTTNIFTGETSEAFDAEDCTLLG